MARIPLDFIDEDHYPGRDLERGFIEFKGMALNLNRLADNSGLDYSYLWRVFNGHRVPTKAYAERIAQHLKLDVWDLLRELDTLRTPAAVED